MSEDIMKMLDHINGADYNKANEILNNLLAQKQSDALEQEKIAVAQAMYSPEDEDLATETGEVDEDDIEIDISDEELEAAAEDLYSEDEDEAYED